MFFKIRNCGLILAFLPPFAFADGILSEPTPAFPLHLILELGGFYGTQGKAQEINIVSLVGNRYTVKSRHSGNGLVGFGLLLDGPKLSRFDLSYGANVFFLGTTSTKGYIVQEHRDTNLSYTYRIQNIPLYFMAKGITETGQEQFKFVLDAGIGPNFIQTSDYNEVALTSFTVPDNGFKGQSSAAFSATVGVGFRYSTLSKAPLECGYRFFYLGQGEVARNNELLLNSLRTGNNYANALICSVTI